MTVRFWCDVETRSPVPIKHGTGRYARQAEIIVFQWAVDDGPVEVIDCTLPDWQIRVESALVEADLADECWAHNAEFDCTILDLAKNVQTFRKIPLEKWRCSAALARMHGLPGGLDKLSIILKLPADEAKDKEGKALIQLFCIPKADGAYNDRHSHPREWAKFLAYADQDVVAMRAAFKLLPKWNATPRMWAVWHLDQRMNRRGVAVDLALCDGAVKATTRAKRRLAERTADMTLGVVEATTQRERLLRYMADYGVNLPDLTADTVERRLNDEALPEHIKELLRIRQQASKASTAKYQRVLNQHVEGRLCNLLVFCGAARTGRWAGRTIQPQNLPRPKHKQPEIETAIRLFRLDEIELYDPDETMGLASSALRGIFVAGEGRKLVVADLANIEGRFMAWVAGEQWKIEAFRAFDEKRGADLYKGAYARAFGIKPEEIGDDDPRRQIGKVMELSLQYYGGVGAFCPLAETYGLDLNQLADAAWPVIPQSWKDIAAERWEKAQKRHRTYGLSERVWMVCEALVQMWREAHPAIVKFWHDLEAAVLKAIRVPNTPHAVQRITIDRRGNWLRIRLPSGRYLSYPAPRIDLENESPSFVGIDPYTKQWKRIGTYSGKLAENIVQAGSADILMDGLLAADSEGYNPVLSIHDEDLCEPPDDPRFTAAGLSKLMTGSSPWAAGLPLAAKGWEAKRYRK